MEKAGFSGLDRNKAARKIRVEIACFVGAEVKSADFLTVCGFFAAVVKIPAALHIASRTHAVIVYQVDGVFYNARVFYHKKHTPFGS